MKKGRVPKFNPANGMKLPPQPNILKQLNDVECALVALYIPFITMYTKRTRGGQWAKKGPVVNVPVDVYSTPDAVYGARLPHLLSDTQTILLKLRRKLSYRTPYMSENIRPGLVMQAIRYLVAQPL